MRDPRVTALARILVGHSTGVSDGDVCTIEGESGAEPLLQAIYEEVLRAGGNPIVQMAMEPPTQRTAPEHDPVHERDPLRARARAARAGPGAPRSGSPAGSR